MTRIATIRLAAGLIAATLGTAGLATPAAAGGSFSITIEGNSPESRRALRTGLELYSAYNAVRSGAAIRQNGRGNRAGIRQDGRGNRGIVHQEGDGHSGTLDQRGARNAHGLFQFGRNTEAHVVQRGRGRTGATFQYGW